MMRSGRLAVLYVVVATLLAVGNFPLATIPVSAQDDVLIGYSAPGLVGAQAQIQAGLVDDAEAKGWEVLTTTSGGDAQKQLNDINDFIAQKVDAIVAVPDRQRRRSASAVKAANEANIPFYTIDRSPIGLRDQHDGALRQLSGRQAVGRGDRRVPDRAARRAQGQGAARSPAISPRTSRSCAAAASTT